MKITVNRRKSHGQSRKFNLSVLLCLFCISWLNNGIVAQFSFINFYVFIAIFAVWFFLTAEKNVFIEINNIWIYIYSGLLFLYSILMTDFFNKLTYGAIYIIVISIFALVYSKSNNRRERKIILLYYLAETLVMAIRTIVTCIADPQFARNIAGQMAEKNELSDFLVAHFDNIYAMCLLSLFLLMISNNAYSKWMCYICTVIYIVCIYFSGFATAALLTLVFLLLAIVVKSPTKAFFVLLAMLLCFLVFKDEIAQFAYFLAEKPYLTDFLKYKLNNIGDTLSGVTYGQQNNTLLMRLEYTQGAITIFLRHPILGIYGNNSLLDERVLLRDHNVWFDLLAYFGVLRIVPFIMMILKWYSINRRNFSRFKYSPLKMVTLFWIVLGFFNPVNKIAVFLVLFLVIPLSDALLKESNEQCGIEK